VSHGTVTPREGDIFLGSNRRPELAIVYLIEQVAALIRDFAFLPNYVGFYYMCLFV